MVSRLLLVAALLVFLAAGLWAALMSPGLRCASLAWPEGRPCREGSFEFAEHGRFIAVEVQSRTRERVAIVAAGTILAGLLLVARDRVTADPSDR